MKKLFWMVLVIIVTSLLITACVQSDLELRGKPNSIKIVTAKLSLTLAYPQSFDPSSISGYKVLVTNESGNVVYENNFATASIYFTIKTSPGLYTVKVEAHTNGEKKLEGTSQVSIEKTGEYNVEVILKFVQTGGNNGSNYQIIADDESHIVGRISYIDVKVLNENGSPAQGVVVKFFCDGQPVVDVLTKQATVVTDSDGVARVAILPATSGVNFYGLQALSLTTASQIFYVDVGADGTYEASFTVSFNAPSWSFLMWICADNNLEPYASNDFSEMRNVNPNVSIIAFFDGISRDKVMVLDELGEWKTIHVFEQDFDSGDHNKLLEAMEFAFGSFGSSHRALVLWDHGSAWIYDSHYWEPSEATFSPQAICFDDTSQNAISTRELKEALQKYTGPNIDMLAMDACLMGSIEILYELRGLIDYVVASSFTVPAYGYDYTFLAKISPTDDAYNVGVKIVDAYKDFYSKLNQDLSLAVYDMDKINDVTDALDLLAKRLVQIMNNNLRNTVRSFYGSLIKYDSFLIDLNDFASKIKLKISDTSAQNYAGQIQNVLEKFVVYEYAKKSNKSIKNPVSIFLPNDSKTLIKYANDYNTLSFCEDFDWADFLESWLQTGDVLY